MDRGRCRSTCVLCPLCACSVCSCCSLDECSLDEVCGQAAQGLHCQCLHPQPSHAARVPGHAVCGPGVLQQRAVGRVEGAGGQGATRHVERQREIFDGNACCMWYVCFCFLAVAFHSCLIVTVDESQLLEHPANLSWRSRACSHHPAGQPATGA